MSTALQVAENHQIDDKSLFALVTNGDASSLTEEQKLLYYKARCDAAGLDYRAQPFQFLRLNGKLVLYALKACTDQLAAKHGIRCEILSQATEDGIRVVTVRATAADGRQTDEIGAVTVKGLSGEALCNAFMKASTKAKRRAILAVCGLGMLDESELDTVPAAAPQPEIKMPTRLSERRSDVRPVGSGRAGDSGVDVRPSSGDGAGSAAVEAQVVEPEVVDALMESIKETEGGPFIEEKDRRHLMALCREHGHDPAVVKRFLARRGISSSKLIPITAYGAIRDRLADPTPLEA